MPATGDHNRPVHNPAVAEAFQQIADIYVEASGELTESDPDLCLDLPEPSQTTAARKPDGGYR
ncbi:hypothetical protein [Candidatus Poriferisodalis sp.]|uniref:hypothetical protein n=1 Tax=Candidatus Poriferisodalis sp. TaxID=3101277 RepID=UPI003B526C96